MIPFFKQKGFTIIELVVSVAIFAFMTAFLVAKYGTLNQGVLLTNLAYDVALTIRNAQTYGLNVKSAPVVDSNGVITQNYSSDFNARYGVHFSKLTTGSPIAANRQMIFFANTTPNTPYPIYDTGEALSTYTLKSASKISAICAGSDESHCTAAPQTLDVSFVRPNPDSTIIGVNGGTSTSYTYAEITVQASDGSTRRVAIRGTGQIAVLHL